MVNHSQAPSQRVETGCSVPNTLMSRCVTSIVSRIDGALVGEIKANAANAGEGARRTSAGILAFPCCRRAARRVTRVKDAWNPSPGVEMRRVLPPGINEMKWSGSVE